MNKTTSPRHSALTTTRHKARNPELGITGHVRDTCIYSAGITSRLRAKKSMGHPKRSPITQASRSLGHRDGVGLGGGAVLRRNLDLDGGAGARHAERDGAARRAAVHRREIRPLADLDRGTAVGLRRRQLHVRDVARHVGGVGPGRRGESADGQRRERPGRARRLARR